MSLIRSRMGLDTMVLAPIAGSVRGAVCLTCGQLVDSEEIVAGYPGESMVSQVLVRHHGAEELRTFDMGSSNWDHADLASMMSRTNWFDPYGHEGLGLGLVAPQVGEHDDAGSSTVTSDLGAKR